MRYLISKQFSICAAHQLTRVSAGHPCHMLHGHNYVVFLHLSSDTLDSTGFVRDYRQLDSFKEWLNQRFDHKGSLNDLMVLPAKPPLEDWPLYELDRYMRNFPQYKPAELNEAVEFRTDDTFFYVETTAELFAMYIYLEWKSRIPELAGVEIRETPNTKALFMAEDFEQE